MMTEMASSEFSSAASQAVTGLGARPSPAALAAETGRQEAAVGLQQLEAFEPKLAAVEGKSVFHAVEAPLGSGRC